MPDALGELTIREAMVILGITILTPESVKSSYRKLVHKVHPDKPTGDAEKFKLVKAAYELLKTVGPDGKFKASGKKPLWTETYSPFGQTNQQVKATKAYTEQQVDKSTSQVKDHDLRSKLRQEAAQQMIDLVRRMRKEQRDGKDSTDILNTLEELIVAMQEQAGGL